MGRRGIKGEGRGEVKRRRGGEEEEATEEGGEDGKSSLDSSLISRSLQRA